jgi:hypothetical protein
MSEPGFEEVETLAPESLPNPEQLLEPDLREAPLEVPSIPPLN